MQTRLGWTPLFIAAWRGHVAIAQRLLEERANPEVRVIPGEFSPCPGSFTALHAAAYQGNRKMVRALLRGGASPRAKVGSRWPEDTAAAAEHKDVASILRLARTERVRGDRR
jgi:ankyrin repeat protein